MAFELWVPLTEQLEEAGRGRKAEELRKALFEVFLAAVGPLLTLGEEITQIVARMADLALEIVNVIADGGGLYKGLEVDHQAMAEIII